MYKKQEEKWGELIELKRKNTIITEVENCMMYKREVTQN